MRNSTCIPALLVSLACSWWIASTSIPQAFSAENEAEQSPGWKFSFSENDFVMTIRYYGPDAEKHLTLTTGTEPHRELIEQREEQKGHVAFLATTHQILNWRSCMHPPFWRGGNVTEGDFTPADDYVGYVVQIQSAGKPMYAKLGWQLETYDALSSLYGCCWKTEPNPFGQFVDSLQEQRRTWAEERYKSLLSKEWKQIVISTGSGSCWGESCSPKVEVLRKGESVRIQRAAGSGGGALIANGSKELAQFQDSLYRYAVHLELHGCCPPNSWKVYKVEVQRAPDQELEKVFYGYEAVFKPLDGKKFDQWLAEVLKGE